jgi:hypothetical protein
MPAGSVTFWAMAEEAHSAASTHAGDSSQRGKKGRIESSPAKRPSLYAPSGRVGKLNYHQ